MRELNRKQSYSILFQLPAQVLIFCALVFISSQSFGNINQPGRIAANVIALKQNNVFRATSDIFSTAAMQRRPQISEVVNDFTTLDVNTGTMNNILLAKPDYLKFNVPVDRGKRNLTLLLYKAESSPNSFTLLTSDGKNYPVNDVVNYRGAIDGDDNSVVSISFAGDEIMGLICNSEGNYVLGKLKNDNQHIVYNDKKLIPGTTFDCETQEAPLLNNYHFKNSSPSDPTTQTTKCVNFYWETDYEVYVNKGSVAAVNSFLQGVFNQVATLYANDGMSVFLKTVYIWNTVDPYTATTVSGSKSQFEMYSPFLTNSASKGDLGILISYGAQGGMAYVSSLCYNTFSGMERYATGYCGVKPTYSNVPVYSWTVENISHEIGHLIGSKHTHACVWNGNNTAIDGCYTTEGGCPSPGLPSDGGTIMSYCHLTSAGINLSNGFGPQPKTLLINKITAATCLYMCGGPVGCTTPAQPGAITGNTTACGSSSQTYSVTAVSGATSYTWTLPSGWTGTSTTNSITVIAGSTGGNISVKANNACGSSSSTTIAVTVITVPTQPGTITGNASVCASSSLIYSVNTVAGATSYLWTLPSGWTGTSTTNSITVKAGSTGGNITVVAKNSCGSSTARTLAVTASTIPSQPGTITGDSPVCANSSQTYSVPVVAGVTNYTWTLPSGWTGSSTTNTITVTVGSASGTISVKANNGCGTSSSKSKSISITKIPSQPGNISGSVSVCTGSLQTYSVSSVTGATSYTWKLPNGWAGTSSARSIGATVGASGGIISVIANNVCGSSAARTLTVTSMSVPPQPGPIIGNMSGSANTKQLFSVNTVTGATSYTWTLPLGWSGSSTSSSINATTGSVGGNITVAAVNKCGIGPSRIAPFSLSALPISLISFTGTHNHDNIKLQWITSSEINNDYFTLEKSADGQQFEFLTRIDGAGNSNTIQSYAFLDEHPLQGVSYYRLSQTDMNGKTSGVNVISVSTLNNTIINLYPNPASTYIHLSSPDIVSGKIFVYDASGRMVMNGEYFYTDFIMDISSLPVGYYSCLIQNSNSVPQQARFIKR